MKQNGRKIWMGILCLMFGIVLLAPAHRAEAASAGTEARKAYAKFLAGKNINWGNDYPVPSKNCSFALAYVDNNSVPELILKNVTDVPHAAGFGQLYTYSGGKVRFVRGVNLDDENFRYYKKKGIYIDCYCGMGLLSNTYYKFAKTSSVWRLCDCKNVASATYSGPRYTKRGSGNQKVAITKKNFTSNLKKLTGGKKAVKAIFRKNTASNRKKYLK